jgi:[ribosomal protein S5]-alanine N-acetyltransferase
VNSFSPFPVLTTPRLTLRQLWGTDDIEVFFLRSDPVVMQFLDTPIAASIDDARMYIQNINNGIALGNWILWSIQLIDDPKMIGSICLWNFSVDKSIAEIGYVLHPNWQRQGLMQEAITGVLDYGFNILHLIKIIAHLHPGNKRSIDLLERNNFFYEKQSGNMVVFALKP